MTNRDIAAAAVTTILLVLGLAEAEETIERPRLLAGGEIRAALAGNTEIHDNRGIRQFHYHALDGTVRIRGSRPQTGRWKVEGDLACFDYGDGFRCWKMAVEGTTVYWFTPGGVLSGRAELRQGDVGDP